MRKYISALAAFACVFASIGPGRASEGGATTITPSWAAPESKPCALTYERATAIGHAVHAADPSNVFTDYGGDQASKLLAAINAAPPATDYPAEHVLVIELPDHDFVTVALVHDGCAKGRLQATTEAWDALRRGAIGDAL